MQNRSNVVLISYLDLLKILFLSCFWGAWMLFKRYTFHAVRFSSKKFIYRDNPPKCLVANTLGQHSYVKLKKYGIKLHYVESGDANKQVVLLLHGFPDCWLTWYNQIPVLSPHFRVIALDLKGFGDSDKPQYRSSYRLNGLLQELVTFIQSLGVSKCHIIGHDIGALLGWYLIHLYPEMVLKFTAISCPHPNIYWSSIPSNCKFNKRWMEFSQLPFLPEIDALDDDVAIINHCYQHLLIDKNLQEYIEAYKYAFSRREDWTGAINYYRSLPFYTLNYELLRQSEVSCLLITGKLDNSVSLESVIKSTEFLQRYYVKVIDDASHYPHQQSPKIFNEALLSFLLDAPLVKKHKSNDSSGLITKLYRGVQSSIQAGTDTVENIRKDPNAAVVYALRWPFYFGSRVN